MPVEPTEEEAAAARTVFGPRLDLAHAYAQALATAGVERGLIGPREAERIWDRHLLNCAVLQELVPDDAELGDVGSGAGLPGIPVAIARPDLTVYLIEPMLRRTTWLREIITELGLTNVEIIRAKAHIVAESGQHFDVVTSRAVAALPTLAEWSMPLVRKDGQLLAIKGDSAEDELVAAGETLTALGAASAEVVRCGESVLGTPTTAVRIVAGRTGKVSKAKKKVSPGSSTGAASKKKTPSSRGTNRSDTGRRR
ncbi:16S rRNA (guanine(527)-N(7))-methyltransferase RsmG [Kineosporia sp. NBRC 101731]|uniref:16S rRNA (guanine(527)-N(7))-methyltransferase RsmG n=1 Tax=Kineosporia sp. NBRC 101731 TaxID=3032199 RepID=UPI00249FB963|nr:16S rRNA (guanine(527)-N(7))-methyltransferase RsmG [Kineosporia sp. NBRC 101731]GLY26871.1 ribosomal RNA small subunit methyltransferase G [Kineosporia sp. NBRC 101731]